MSATQAALVILGVIIAAFGGAFLGWSFRDARAEREDWQRWWNGCRHQPDYYTYKRLARCLSETEEV